MKFVFFLVLSIIVIKDECSPTKILFIRGWFFIFNYIRLLLGCLPTKNWPNNLRSLSVINEKWREIDLFDREPLFFMADDHQYGHLGWLTLIYWRWNELSFVRWIVCDYDRKNNNKWWDDSIFLNCVFDQISSCINERRRAIDQ